MIKNKMCPVCRGKGKVKIVKPVAHIFSWHLGKDEEEPCHFCSLQELNVDNERNEIGFKIH